MIIDLKPIAFVSNSRSPIDNNCEAIISNIELANHIPTEAFTGISEFSHLEVIYYHDKVKDDDIVFSGLPRGVPQHPWVGFFAQRKKDRLNKIGLSIVELIALNGRTIKVKSLDAIDGAPVLDIKPVFKEFQPKVEIRQPACVADLMKNYWRF
jgi:tRNA (adenine37-N6)-methyltransferase